MRYSWGDLPAKAVDELADELVEQGEIELAVGHILREGENAQRGTRVGCVEGNTGAWHTRNECRERERVF